MRRDTELKKQVTGWIAFTLIALLVQAPGAAQETPRRLYGSPIGLTQADTLRVVIAPAAIRIQGPALFCEADVTVEILDALTMSVLETFGPTLVSVGSGFQADFTAAVGAPPERREVVVRTTIERKPGRPVERGTLAEMCPLVGSGQIFDTQTGRTLAATSQNPEFVPDVDG